MNHLFLSALAKVLPRVFRVGGQQALSVLIYHRILPTRDELRPAEPTKHEFDWHMELISRHFNPLSLADAVAGLNAGTLPERAVCVTFDDGYEDNLTVALPILQRWNVPATVFIASAFLDGGIMWNDAIIEAVRGAQTPSADLSWLGLTPAVMPLATTEDKLAASNAIIQSVKYRPDVERQLLVQRLVQELGSELPNNLMLSSEQVRQLRDAGVTIGAHTHTHPILKTLDMDAARCEIEQGRQSLEAILDDRVTIFAYPNGVPGKDFSEEQRALVENLGFQCAVTTQWGVSTAETDKWMLRRFTPWDQNPLRFMARLYMNMKPSVQA